MRKCLIGVGVVAVAVVALAADYTDIASPQYYGKTGIPAAYAVIDANNALIEAGNQKVATQTTTNGSSITLAAQVTVLTGTGMVNDQTNIVTIAQPYTVGGNYKLVVANASSNLVTIADDGTVMALGSSWVGDNGDTLELLAIATNEMVKISSSDN
jgi:hypothetical protein